MIGKMEGFQWNKKELKFI